LKHEFVPRRAANPARKSIRVLNGEQHLNKAKGKRQKIAAAKNSRSPLRPAHGQPAHSLGGHLRAKKPKPARRTRPAQKSGKHKANGKPAASFAGQGRDTVSGPLRQTVINKAKSGSRKHAAQRVMSKRAGRGLAMPKQRKNFSNFSTAAGCGLNFATGKVAAASSHIFKKAPAMGKQPAPFFPARRQSARPYISAIAAAPVKLSARTRPESLIFAANMVFCLLNGMILHSAAL
jgi:hypothetical protein